MPAEQTASTKLIGLVYECALDPNAWDELTRILREEFNSPDAGLAIMNRHGAFPQILRFSGLRGELIQPYQEEYGVIDPFWPVQEYLADHPQAKITRTHFALPERLTENRFITEFWPNMNVVCTVRVPAPINDQCLWVALMPRQAEHGRYSDSDFARLNELRQHMCRAGRLMAKHSAHREALTSLQTGLDHLRFGILHLTQTGQVTWTNAAARKLLSANLGVRQVAEELRFTHARQRKEILQAIEDVCSDSPQGDSARLVTVGKRLEFCVCRPIAERDIQRDVVPAQGPSAVVFLTDQAERPVVSATLMKHAFGLTEAEASVVVSLCAGQSLTDIAHQRGVSVETVRNQLKMSFTKTGCRRQTELVATAMGYCADLRVRAIHEQGPSGTGVSSVEQTADPSNSIMA